MQKVLLIVCSSLFMYLVSFVPLFSSASSYKLRFAQVKKYYLNSLRQVS